MTLSDPISNITGVGQTIGRRLNDLGITTIRDLLFYFPWRYDNFGQSVPMAGLGPGQTVNVSGQVELIQSKKSHRRRMNITEALVSDDSGSIRVVWFNQPFIGKSLHAGDHISLAGRVQEDMTGLVLASPTYEKISSGRTLHTQGLVPNYHLTAGITHKQLRYLLSQVLPLAKDIPDFVPPEIIKTYQFLPLDRAISKIHFPASQAEIDAAKRRLGFNELFLLQLNAQLVSRNLATAVAQPIKFDQTLTTNFVQSLPFKLTDDQKKAAWEALGDLAKAKPMTRMLEGDVGSGKTMVAAILAVNVAAGLGQAALMAPTAILARQHFLGLSKILAPLNISTALLISGQTLFFNLETSTVEKISRLKLLQKISVGEISLVLGTHALIAEAVAFKNLVLAIVDEQHRFGVRQRQSLLAKAGNGLTPHLMSMTATPIPRSLALALYGDLNISIIKQKPASRLKIITEIISDNERARVYAFVRQQITDGRQVFVVCPLIDEADQLGIKSVKAEYERLKQFVFGDLAIGLLHGKLKTKDKEQVMQDFLDQKYQILVATSVIEVGVDVPNATVMLIENAERFGLAQLHQYRGRVGRDIHQSYCFLLTDAQSGPSLQRLQAMLEFDDGFALAKADLKFRGPGEVYGVAQKGFPELKLANLFDLALMKQAKDAAANLLAQDATLNSWPILCEEASRLTREAHLE